MHGMVSSRGSWSSRHDPRKFAHDSDKRIAETNMTYDRLHSTVSSAKQRKLLNDNFPRVSSGLNVNK